MIIFLESLIIWPKKLKNINLLQFYAYYIEELSLIIAIKNIIH